MNEYVSDCVDTPGGCGRKNVDLLQTDAYPFCRENSENEKFEVGDRDGKTGKSDQ